MTEVEKIARGYEDLSWLDIQGRKGSVRDRFWLFVERAGPLECWRWKGTIGSRGYGRMHTPISSSTPAHKISVMLEGQTIPHGLVVDHICRNRDCVNPQHLRVVDVRTNAIENSSSVSAINSSRTLCKHGHEFVYYTGKNGRTHRKCVICQHHYAAAYRLRCGQKNLSEKRIPIPTGAIAMTDTTPEAVAGMVEKLLAWRNRNNFDYQKGEYAQYTYAIEAAAMLTALSAERDQARADLAEAVEVITTISNGPEKDDCWCGACRQVRRARTFLAKHKETHQQ